MKRAGGKSYPEVDKVARRVSKAEEKVSEITQKLDGLKKYAGNAHSVDYKRAMLSVYYELTKKKFEDAKDHPEGIQVSADSINQTANLLHCSTRKLLEVKKQYETTNTLTDTIRVGNPTAKETRLPKTKRFRLATREFIRDRHREHKLTTATDLLAYYKELKVIDYIDGDKKSYNSAIRTVQRYVIRYGFSRGRNKKTLKVGEGSALAMKRNKYLEALLANRRIWYTWFFRRWWSIDKCFSRIYRTCWRRFYWSCLYFGFL